MLVQLKLLIDRPMLPIFQVLYINLLSRRYTIILVVDSVRCDFNGGYRRLSGNGRCSS
jgi:hypothetical protein